MIQPHAFESSPTSEQPTPPVKKSGGIIALLCYLTLANAVGLVFGIAAWADWSDHGSSYDDDLLRAAIFATFLSVIALVALGGAWRTRTWGPRLYLATTVLGMIIGLISGLFSPLGLVGFLIAVGLWIHAEGNW